ncbi:MAG TPA: glycosyltransferase family 39 protein [Candidatus Paceibacterota bacterium]|nr:glycosyltransferase family 39 protein [Candidatus Paceibacterota bacterium]
MEAVAKYRTPLAAVAALAVLLFSGYCLFYKLGNEPFQDYDEATYAQVTHESLEHGNLSGLTFLNQPYFRKPPLLFWMTTASSHLFADAEFADRFPSALAGIAAIILVALICIEAGAGIGTGLVAAGILATTATWMEFARDVRFDNLVAFFALAAFYAGMRAVRDSRWFVMVGITLALAILSKSVMAIFGGIGVLAILLFEKKLLRSFRDRWLWFGVAAFMLVAAPWHLYMTITYGTAFWHSYLGTEVLERASTNLFPGGTNPTNADYLSYLASNAAPWIQLFILSCAGMPFFFRRMAGTLRTVFAASFIVVLSVVAVAFVSETKAFGYLIPMYPFLAVFLALAGRELWRAEAKSRFADTLTLALAALTIALFAYAAVFTRYEALHIDPYYGWELSQAYEEHAIGEMIAQAQHPEVYVYGNYGDLGSIYYYSKLPDTKNPFILLWSASSTPASSSTAFIIASSSLASLSNSFPDFRFTQAYSGNFVSLFTAAAR